jgi:hypothetical protein
MINPRISLLPKVTPICRCHSRELEGTHLHMGLQQAIVRKVLSQRCCVVGLWERHTVGGCRQSRAWTGVWNPLAGPAAEGDTGDGWRSHGDTVSHSKFNYVPVQIPGLASWNTLMARSCRYMQHLGLSGCLVLAMLYVRLSHLQLWVPKLWFEETV